MPLPSLFTKAYALARPYGRKKMVIVFALCLAQGVFQVLGVTSIFPFLALAADPARLRNSRVGQIILEALPPMDDRQLLIGAGVFALVMLLAANAVNLLAEYARTRYAQRFGHWLRVRLVEDIASRPYGDFLQLSVGILQKKVMGDVAMYITGVLLPLLDAFARLITLLLLLFTLFLVHFEIALGAALFLGGFYILVFKGFGAWRKRTLETLKDANRGTGRELIQLLGGIKPIKVHGVEQAFVNRFAVHSDRASQCQAKIPLVSNGPRYLVEPLAFGGLVIAVLVYAAKGENLISILPNLGVMALAGYRLLPAAQLFYGQLTQMGTMRHALDEVFDEFLAVEKAGEKEQGFGQNQAVHVKPQPFSKQIEFRNVRFQYPGSKEPVFEELNLVVPKNQSLGITGPSGCGKSTLVDLLLGLHFPTEGELLVDGVPVTAANRRAWRANIGYVPQDIFLTDDSIAANIALGISKKNRDPELLREVARSAQILDLIENDLPEGWETTVGERGVRLSGGQRQRIGLARALYRKPSLLVLDEATSALDIDTESEVMRAIRSLQGSLTLVVIAHRLSTVESCEVMLNLTPANRAS